MTNILQFGADKFFSEKNSNDNNNSTIMKIIMIIIIMKGMKLENIIKQ